jgi:cysteine desulfurase
MQRVQKTGRHGLRTLRARPPGASDEPPFALGAPGPRAQRSVVPYFDHNATHPLSPAARQAWLDATERFPANPSSPHRLGDRASRALDEAREKLAAFLGAAPHEIVWTSGATESNNLALAHLAAERPGELLLSAIEHPCVRAAAARHFGERHRAIPVSREGVLDLDWLRAALSAKTAAVAVMAANNETGVLQPWPEVAALCRAHGVPLLCDAAQWLGKLPAAGLGVADFVSGCAHKFGGPPGVGFLKCPVGTRPLLVGGPQEDGRRAGTENVPGVLAMLAALAERETTPASDTLRAEFEQALRAALPAVRILGADAPRLWNTCAVLMPPPRDCRQRWVVRLDRLGCAVSTGSACASGKEQPSPVLAAMGYTPAEAGRALRFSAGWTTTAEDWRALLAALGQAAQALTELPAPPSTTP